MNPTQDKLDEKFLDRVEELVGRELTADEKALALTCRDHGRYSTEAAAIEILVCEPKS